MFKKLVVCGLLAVVAGCGGPSNPPTHKVTGTVMFDGKPVEGASVTFKPEEGSSNQAAVGTTLADGTYQLTSFAANDGAMVGAYKVVVTKSQIQDGGESPYGAAPPAEAGDDDSRLKEMTDEERDQMMEDQYAAATKKGMKEGSDAPKALLPKKYGDIRTTDLSYTVVEGDNTYDITLEK